MSLSGSYNQILSSAAHASVIPNEVVPGDERYRVRSGQRIAASSLSHTLPQSP
jgi:hypothetical protein